MADGIPTDPPTSREIDFGALVRKALGDEYHKHEKVYQVGRGRTFESSDYGTQGIYGSAPSIIFAGTAAGGSRSSIILGTEANGDGFDYGAHQITVADFALTTQTSTIVAYNESTKSANVVPAWGSNFVLHTGTAQGAGSDYLTLGTGAPSVVSGTLSLTSGAGSTQSRDILSYDGPSKRAVVSRWDAPYLDIGSDDDGTQATFYLDFPDLGSGQVDTTPTFGTVSPTFTRSGATATTVGSDGLVIKSIGANVPRSYYDPTSLTYLGYLAEGARTNLCLQSENLATTWTTPAASISANATTAPDGTSTADKLVEASDVGQTHFLTQSIVKAGSEITYAWSIWAKAAERTKIQLRIDGNTSNRVTAEVDLSAGTIGSATAAGVGWTAVSSFIKAYPNGWYRCGIVATSSTETVVRTIAILEDAGGGTAYNGDGTSGAYFWGAQLEAAAFASSYIPTTTASVARNADVLTYPTTGWLNASAGTLFGHGQIYAVTTAQGIASLDDGSVNNRIDLRPNSTANSVAIITAATVGQATLTGTTWTINVTHKMTVAYASNDAIMANDGSLSSPDTSVTVPTVTTLSVGSLAAGAFQNFGPIRRVAYFPRRLLNATLVTLTGTGLTFDPATFPVALPDNTTAYRAEKVGPGVNTTYSISAT
jgi:hypothetical protein